MPFDSVMICETDIIISNFCFKIRVNVWTLPLVRLTEEEEVEQSVDQSKDAIILFSQLVSDHEAKAIS